jgi:hypothetical protein
MSKGAIVKGFALLKFGKEASSEGTLRRHICPKISLVEQDLPAIARFSGIDIFPPLGFFGLEKVLTSLRNSNPLSIAVF